MPVESIDPAELAHLRERDDHEALAGYIMPEDDTLAARTAVSRSCVALYQVIEVCFQIRGNEVMTTLKIYDTPIGRAILTPEQECIELDGHLDGVSIQLEACLDIDDLTLVLRGMLCVPLAGCKQFEKVFQL